MRGKGVCNLACMRAGEWLKKLTERKSRFRELRDVLYSTIHTCLNVIGAFTYSEISKNMYIPTDVYVCM